MSQQGVVGQHCTVTRHHRVRKPTGQNHDATATSNGTLAVQTQNSDQDMTLNNAKFRSAVRRVSSLKKKQKRGSTSFTIGMTPPKILKRRKPPIRLPVTPENDEDGIQAEGTIDVHVSINVVAFRNVSTVSHQFTAQFFLILHWRPPPEVLQKLSAIEAVPALQRGAERDYWASGKSYKPEPEFTNAAQIDISQALESDPRRYPRLDPQNKGFLKLTMNATVVFASKLNLKSFPFDSQELNIEIKFRRWQDRMVRAQVSALRPSKVDMSAIEVTDLVILPGAILKDGETGETSTYTCTFVAQRAWGRYLYDILLIQFFLGIISWSFMLFVPTTETVGRLQLLLALLLTAVAFKFAVNDLLPKLPYMSALDWYVYWSFNFLFVHCLETSVLGAMYGSTKESIDADKLVWGFSESAAEHTKTIEIWLTRIVGGLWVFFQLCALYFITSSMLRMRRERREDTVRAKQLEVKLAKRKQNVKKQSESQMLKQMRRSFKKVGQHLTESALKIGTVTGTPAGGGMRKISNSSASGNSNINSNSNKTGPSLDAGQSQSPLPAGDSSGSGRGSNSRPGSRRSARKRGSYLFGPTNPPASALALTDTISEGEPKDKGRDLSGTPGVSIALAE